MLNINRQTFVKKFQNFLKGLCLGHYNTYEDFTYNIDKCNITYMFYLLL
jgi:hypothetical protein